MQVALEDSSGLTRRLRVVIPKEQIDSEISKRVKELTKTIKLKGFRPGKTPESVIRQRYGAAIREEVAKEKMRETLPQALEQEKLQPAGMPSLEVTHYDEGQDLEYTATFEVYPDVKLASLEGETLEKTVAEITDADVNKTIESLRKQNVHWKEVDRAAKNEDQVTIDFEGFMNGEPFKGGSAKNFKLVLGSNQMIPGFESQLIGATKDETREIQVTFPENYHAKDLAGQEAAFKVTVAKVSEPTLPEINDAFAKELGVTEGTVDGLHKEVRESMDRELKRRVREDLKVQIIDKLLELNQIEIPESLINHEIERIQDQFQRQFMAQTGQKKAPRLPNEQVQEQARKNVTLGLLLSQWIKENNLKVDPALVRSRIEEIASGYSQPDDVVNWYYHNKEALSEVQGSVLEEQAIDGIVEQLKVIEKSKTYDEVINPNKGTE